MPGCFSGKADCCILLVSLSAWPLTEPFAASSSASNTPSSSVGWSGRSAPSPCCDTFVRLGLALVPDSVAHSVVAVDAFGPWVCDAVLVALGSSISDGLLFWCEASGFCVVKMDHERLPWWGL